MPLPLLWIGAGLVGAAVTAEHMREKAQELADKDELRRLLRDDAIPYDGGEEGGVKMPSDVLTSDTVVKPVPGTVVCCGVFGAFDHTGIWVEDDLIVELHGSGLIKAVSVARFLDNRSGVDIFAACDSTGEPLVIKGTSERALEQVFTYWKYEVRDNNCHRFVWQCISGEDRRVPDFADFNQLVAKQHNKMVYWDKVDLDQLLTPSLVAC